MALGEVVYQHPSSPVAVCAAFAFLWLSLYVFRVNPDDAVSKLASGAMFTIFLYLLSNFLVSTATSKSLVVFYQRALWWLPFAPVLWLHLSQKATQPVQFRGTVRYRLGTMLNATRSGASIGAFYGIAFLFFLAGASTESLFNFDAIQSASLPLKTKSIPTGPGFLLFALFILATSSIAWMNFLAAWWRESKQAEEERFFRRGITGNGNGGNGDVGKMRNLMCKQDATPHCLASA